MPCGQDANTENIRPERDPYKYSSRHEVRSTRGAVRFANHFDLDHHAYRNTRSSPAFPRDSEVRPSHSNLGHGTVNHHFVRRVQLSESDPPLKDNLQSIRKSQQSHCKAASYQILLQYLSQLAPSSHRLMDTAHPPQWRSSN